MFVPRFLGQLRGGGSRRQGAPVRKPLRFRPGLELLECRLTPATADVTASVVFGNLTITDNAATSQLRLSQPAADEITITPDGGTTINGRAGPVTFFGLTGNLNVNLGAGIDTLTFDLSQHDISVGNVSITGNTGAKAVVTDTFTDTARSTHTLNVRGNYKEIFGNGNQFTRLNQFNVSGNLTIDHANGDAFVFLGVDRANLGRQFNSVAGDLTVANVTASGAAASGSDVNALEETNVGGDLTADMGRGDARTGFGGWTSVGSQSNQPVTVGGNVTITARTGLLAGGDFANDGEEVQNAQVGGDVTMDLGSGVGNTALFGGGTADFFTSASAVTVTGRGAHDAVTVGPSFVLGDLAVSLTGHGGNAVAVDAAFAGDLAVSLTGKGGGNTIAVDSVFVDGDTSLLAAGGSNSIAIDNQDPGSAFGGRVDIAMMGTDNLLAINSKGKLGGIHGGTAQTTFDGEVSANLGAGNGTLVLAEVGEVVFETAARFNGGPGQNTALVNGANVEALQGDPTLVNFS